MVSSIARSAREMLKSVVYADVHIPSPVYVVKKRAVINITNKDDKFFLWSVLASLHPQKSHSERMVKYQQFECEVNTNGLAFPVVIPWGVRKFENLNSPISVNVFAFDGKTGSYRI
jgi:hypothetical protein